MGLRPPRLAVRALAAFQEARARRQEADPQGTQEATLAGIRRVFGGTVLGQRQALGSIRSLAELKAAPVSQAEGLQDLIELAWEKNPAGLMSPEPLRYLMKTTGTSGQTKKMPYPLQAARAHGALELAIATAFIHETGKDNLLSGHFLITAGSSVIERGPTGVALGYPTGISTDMAPWWAGDLVRPSKDIRANSDYHSRLEATLQQVYPLDIRVMTGVPAWVPPQLERLMAMAAERGHGMTTARDLWPNLSLYVWAGSPIGPYESLLRRLFGPEVAFREVYSAGEAPIAYQAREHDAGLRPFLSHTVFLLQDPAEGFDAPKLALWEAELDKPYRLLPTTPSGVVNLNLGDLVVVTQKSPLRLRFFRREVEAFHLGAERAGLDQVADAWAESCRAAGLEPGPFVAEGVAPDGTVRPYYRLHAEVPVEALPQLLMGLEKGLGDRNPLINSMRSADLLGPMELVAMAPGSLLSHLATTKLFGQGKPSVLLRDPAEGESLREAAIGRLGGPG